MISGLFPVICMCVVSMEWAHQTVIYNGPVIRLYLILHRYDFNCNIEIKI